jgi:YggT family protein
MIYTLVGIVDLALAVLMWVIILQVILSWLIVLNVINVHTPAVRSFIAALERLTAPLYRPIRRIMPDFGGIDFSPMVIILVIVLIRTRVLPGILLEVGPTIT